MFRLGYSQAHQILEKVAHDTSALARQVPGARHPRLGSDLSVFRGTELPVVLEMELSVRLERRAQRKEAQEMGQKIVQPPRPANQ